jgi:hypothetical protein
LKRTMATRSATLAIVRDFASAESAARPAPQERKPKPRPRSPAELAERVDGLEVQLEGLQAQLAAREQQLATLVDTVEKQRLENIQLIDLVLAASRGAGADGAAKKPPDPRPKWLQEYGICKRTGELIILTQSGWELVGDWHMNAERRARVVAELAKYPRPSARSSR